MFIRNTNVSNSAMFAALGQGRGLEMASQEVKARRPLLQGAKPGLNKAVHLATVGLLISILQTIIMKFHSDNQCAVFHALISGVGTKMNLFLGAYILSKVTIKCKARWGAEPSILIEKEWLGRY